MRLKRTCGKIFGVDLTSAEKKAMEMEIQRQLAEFDLKNIREIDAIVLWNLHAEAGWGHKRLKRFYKTFNASLRDLIKRYELDVSDMSWLCTYKLKEYGIDLEEWEKETEE